MRVSMMRFSQKLVAELFQPFWAAWQAGEFMTDAAAVAGTYRQRGLAWVRESGGVRPRRGRDLAGRYLSFAEREEIALGRARGESVRSLAGRLHRSPSTVSRELARNTDRDGVYRAGPAHTRAYARAGRPKPAKLAANPRLRAVVQTYLTMKYSPEQIAGRLRREYPHDPEMWVSTETIYQSLYVQSRGALRRDLARYLRTGRSLRVPNRQGTHRKNRVLPDMINISERPAAVEDRAVPGDGGRPHHRQGQRLGDRHPGRAKHRVHHAGAPARGLSARADGPRPEHEDPHPARGTAAVTDQGVEMRDWKTVAVATDIAIYFCDPHSPWQRGTNENTVSVESGSVGLLSQAGAGSSR